FHHFIFSDSFTIKVKVYDCGRIVPQTSKGYCNISQMESFDSDEQRLLYLLTLQNINVLMVY
ncbi:hypothetical protein C1141_14885, partial [Vibrio agarivorans]